jgi:hypothetical protein
MLWLPLEDIEMSWSLLSQILFPKIKVKGQEKNETPAQQKNQRLLLPY